MARETTHILYEWEPTTEVEIAGQTRQYNGGYHSLILHRLDSLKHFSQIPANVQKTPVYYDGYTEKWHVGNGRELQLPYKLR